MKLSCALGASLLLFAAVPAMAASYPGEEITVNPGAFGNGYLLYPGGKYGRHVGALRQPGDRGGPIHLHMPVKHVARAKPHTPRVAAAADGAITIPDAVPAAPATPRPPKHVARPPRQVAAAAPPPAATPAPTSDPSAMPEDSAARLFGGGDTATPTPAAPPPAAARPPKPAKPAKPTRTAATPAGDAAIPFSLDGSSPPPKPARTASATPPPANTTTPPATAAGLKRQSVIPFAEGSSSPAAADVNAVHTLATTLNAALNAGAARVQLEAYGGPRGDKSSDSRRLSLKRALVIRELLIEDGVPSEKIDVRAMGGADDSGAADRVDVFLRA
ncbi:MAG TPA: OmpA family protein [Rhizomicrobium sp.]|jgi:outer membrane protein OmpA-like peptidoglycan-associated protein|nr:OmpA family protein [Rhizomicrobium sp.]